MSIDLTAFDALSFDCYGTLIDWETGMLRVLGPLARRQQPGLSDEELLAAFAEAEAGVESANPKMYYPHVLRESYRRVAHALGFEPSDADAGAFADSIAGWPAFADSPDALQRLKRRYKLLILSNVHRDGFAASNRHLQVEFDAILTAEDVGAYKPSARNFQALLGRAGELGVPDGRLLHVAQSLFHYHAPARKAGLASVWINRRNAKEGWGATPEPCVEVFPDLEFPSMAAFAAAVDEAFTAR